MNRLKPCLNQTLRHVTLAGALCVPGVVLAGTTGARADATARSHAHPTQENTAMYRTQLQLQPAQARVGQPVTLTLTVRDGEGRAVSKLTPSHERDMHLFVVSRDLRDFAHVHPTQVGDAFRLQHTFAAAGEYLVVVDYQEPGHGQRVDRHSLQVSGPARAPAPLTESPSATQAADGVALTLHAQRPLRAGQGVHLRFDVTDAASGKPVTDLEPYLGAMAHFAVLSEDTKDFLHVHPMDADSVSSIAAHAVFPRAGLYKLWAQVQRRGVVATVPFVLRVEGARASAEAASPGASAHAGGHHGH